MHHELELPGTILWQLHPGKSDTGECCGAGVGAKLFRLMSGGQRDDPHAGGSGGVNSRRCVLDDHAIGWTHPESGRSHQIDVGARLTMPDVLGADEYRGNWQAGSPQPILGDHAHPGGRNRPAAGGELGEKCGGTIHRSEGRAGPAVVVRLERGDLGLRIELGCGKPYRLHRPAAVAHAKERFRLETPSSSPATPLLLDVAGGVHQHAVEIEENCPTLEAFHTDPG
jgi:hypothetical protein